MFPPDVVDILRSGPSILVGTRDASLRPGCARCVGARREPDDAQLTLYLPDATARRSLADLRDNGRIAVVFTRVDDNRSFQAKGRALEVRPAGAADREVVERYLAEFRATVALLGCPPRLTDRLARWPCQAVRMSVEELFVQTPGPGAGAALGRGS